MVIKKPPMGFNTWNTFSRDISDQLMRETVDKMAELGFRDYGYEYIVIDDCWSEKSRDENGRLVPDRNKFPNGIKPVADYVHSKGFKFGIYSCVGNLTCDAYPGSLEHEFIDAQTFAEWGVDYLKFDYCFKPNTENGDLLYKRMALALANCGRDILFSACNWGADDSKLWIKETGSHMWRSGPDIKENWESIKGIYQRQFDLLPYCSPACFNDMDMLVIGMNGKGAQSLGGCTKEEYRTHFSIWSMFASPLMIGCDARNVDDESFAIMTNKDVIAINQDEACWQPYKVEGTGCSSSYADIWVRHLANGDLAIGMFNIQDGGTRGFLSFPSIGLNRSCNRGLQLKDLWTGEDLGVFEDFYLSDWIPAHGCKMFRAKVVEL